MPQGYKVHLGTAKDFAGHGTAAFEHIRNPSHLLYNPLHKACIHASVKVRDILRSLSIKNYFFINYKFLIIEHTMDIYITFGIGEGLTKISAYDSALIDAGIGNFNIIYLSSIIPPRSNIKLEKLNLRNDLTGHKLFAVISHIELDEIGQIAYSGLGWLFDEEKGGLFVEYSSNKYEETYTYIDNSLNSMNRSRQINSKATIKIIDVECIKNPVSAVVAAVYNIQGWDTNVFF